MKLVVIGIEAMTPKLASERVAQKLLMVLVGVEKEKLNKTASTTLSVVKVNVMVSLKSPVPLFEKPKPDSAVTSPKLTVAAFALKEAAKTAAARVD